MYVHHTKQMRPRDRSTKEMGMKMRMRMRNRVYEIYLNGPEFLLLLLLYYFNFFNINCTNFFSDILSTHSEKGLTHYGNRNFGFIRQFSFAPPSIRTWMSCVLRFVALNSVESRVCEYVPCVNNEVNENVTLLICSHEFPSRECAEAHFFNYFGNIVSTNLINVCRSIG